MNAPLPQQQFVLSVTKNKVQLIELICEELQQLDDVPHNTSLVITGRSPVPMEVRSDALVQRFDLKMTDEEGVSSFLSKWWRWQIWGVKQLYIYMSYVTTQMCSYYSPITLQKKAFQCH